MRNVAINNPAPGQKKNPSPPSVWDAFTGAIQCCPAVLESSPVVAILKERGKEDDEVICRQVAMHAPPFNAWGVQFKACGMGCTDVVPSDFAFRVDRLAVRCICTLCGWKSCRLKHDEVSDLVRVLTPELPLVYWHPYPPPPQLLDVFPRITKQRRP